MEETASRCRRQLRIYWISSHEQPTRGGSPAWGLRVGLTTPHRKKKKLFTKCDKGSRTWTDSLDICRLKYFNVKIKAWKFVLPLLMTFEINWKWNKVRCSYETGITLYAQTRHWLTNQPSMYVCIRGGPEIRPLHRDLQWSIVLPLLINPILILPFEWSVGLYLWEHHNSHLVP
jgi:hypothetical protein